MGNRIELGEIETVLLKIDGVLDGVVLFNDSPIVADKCIAALVCLRDGTSKAEVASALETRLPSYMVPRRIDVTGALPRTPNGKADRRAAMALVFREA
jgi:acyl-coenzyme A synthetase/AMP-(fatty) acid ligase